MINVIPVNDEREHILGPDCSANRAQASQCLKISAGKLSMIEGVVAGEVTQPDCSSKQPEDELPNTVAVTTGEDAKMKNWSMRVESNHHCQFGRLELCH
jgi:hypothetical protein